MVDSLPPSGTSGTDPDNETIITNSNGNLSVPLDDEFLDVGSSGKVELIETTYYLANFGQDSGDWTGIDSVSDGIAKVNVPSESSASASVTADLTDIDKLNFRIELKALLSLEIEFDGIREGEIGSTDGFYTLEISGLDDYGPNTTVTMNGIDGEGAGAFRIDYVRGLIQPGSRIIELVDSGGL